MYLCTFYGLWVKQIDKRHLMCVHVVTHTGITGMQPSDIKGDGSRRRQWSCYDPDRITREDYINLPMDTDALTRATASNMIESVDGGK